MALRFVMKRSIVNCAKVNNLRALLGFGAAKITNIIDHSSNFSRSYNVFPPFRYDDLRHRMPPITFLPDYSTYCQQFETTMGFGIDVDLGDYPEIIRPYSGSLDDPQVTTPARFAVDSHNKSEGKHIQFLKVVKANVFDGIDHMYYLTFEGIDDTTGSTKRYVAQVDVDLENNKMELLLFGDADNPPQQSTRVAFWSRFCGLHWDLTENFDPEFMTALPVTYPRDCFKVRKPSQIIKQRQKRIQNNPFEYEEVPNDYRAPFHEGNDCMDDPETMTLARFAVEQYNKEEEDSDLQFVRVIKATMELKYYGSYYYLTLEVLDENVVEKKIYNVLISIEKDFGTKLVSFIPVDTTAI